MLKLKTIQSALGALAAVALVLALAACGSGSDTSTTATGGGSDTTAGSAPAAMPGKGKPAVTLGDKNFTESFVLGQLYKQALEAKGFTVALKGNIGSTELIDKAITSGRIDMYPEYTGVMLSTVAHDTKRYSSAEATYQAAKKFQESRGLTLLDKTPFQNVDAMATTTATAKKYGLKSIPDLKKLPKPLTIGGAPEFKTRFSGLVGLAKVYGIKDVDFKPLSIGLQYKALDNGDVMSADVFTTDGQLEGGKYAVLSDPKGVMGFQNVAPIVRKQILTKEGPAFAQTLNAVSAKLTTEAMQKMNGAVDLDKQDPAAVAKTFLSANGLL